MREQERLFRAIGGVDERLLERSERAGRRGRVRCWLAWTAAAAACVAVVAAAWLWTWSAPAPEPADPDPAGPVVRPEGPPAEDPEEPPRLAGQGEYHLLNFSLGQYDDPGAWPPFSIYYSEADYYAYQPWGSYFIRPRNRAEGMPLCQLEISHRDACTLEEAVERERTWAERLYETVTLVDENTADRGVGLPENTAPLCLVASNGTAWDDRQRRSWFVEDGQGGVFALSASFFLEAEEGLGARFFDMVCTFKVEDGADAPAWQTDLEDASERLIGALCAGDLTSAEDLLALEEPAGEVLSRLEGTSVAKISYSVSQEEGGLSAAVAVKYRQGAEMPYEYLDMGLSWAEGSWRATRLGIQEEAAPAPVLPGEDTEPPPLDPA